MNDPTAQMGFSVGKSAVMAGTDYVEQNVSDIPAAASTIALLVLETSFFRTDGIYSSTATFPSRH